MLEELRRKPKPIRNLYAFWGAVLLTALIGGIWLLATVVKFSATETTEGITNTTSAFSQFIDRLKDGFKEEPPAATSTEPKATTTVPKNTTSATTSPKYPPILVATTTSQKVQIGTSSPVAE